MSNAILQHVYLTATDMNANSSPQNITSTCVCLRTTKGVFNVFPRENDSSVPFEEAICGLDPAVAVKICTPAVHALVKRLLPEEDSLHLDADTTIQVLETMEHLSFAEKCQRAALIRDENVLIVWADIVDDVLPLLAQLDDKFIQRLWRQPKARVGKKPSSSVSASLQKHSFRFLNLFRLGPMERKAKGSASSLQAAIPLRTMLSAPSSLSRRSRLW